jgi:hypothetical protein
MLQTFTGNVRFVVFLAEGAAFGQKTRSIGTSQETLLGR